MLGPEIKSKIYHRTVRNQRKKVGKFVARVECGAISCSLKNSLLNVDMEERA
jgi:hypothetical protein